MLEAGSASRSALADATTRRQVALDRVNELIGRAEQRAARAWRNYYLLQVLTVGLAAITPCLIVLAKENPRNELLNWLQLFFPAVAAICAGASHLFRWREDGVRYTELAEAIRSELWRYQTRSGDCGPALSDDQALDYLVTHVDELNLKSVSRWASTTLADTSTPAPAAARSA